MVPANGDSYWCDYFYSTSYTVEGIMPGDYYVVADAENHADGIYNGLSCAGEYPDGCDPTAGTLVTIGEGTALTGINFALQRLASLSGTVVDAKTGTPLSGFRVRQYNSDGTSGRSDYSDSSGAFDINGLWPGT
jgi:hypothetical protein